MICGPFKDFPWMALEAPKFSTPQRPLLAVSLCSVPPGAGRRVTMSLALQEPIGWHELRAESFTQAHLIDKISVPGRAKSAQGRRVGAQTPTTIIHNLSHRVPHPTKDRGVMLQKNTPKKAEMPAQLFLIMVAICSTKELLVVPKTPSNSESHWSIQVLIYIPRRM